MLVRKFQCLLIIGGGLWGIPNIMCKENLEKKKAPTFDGELKFG